MQRYEGGDFFRLYGSDVSYTDYRRNPTCTVGIPAGAGGVWEPLTNNDKIIGGNTIDGAYLVDETYLVWHATSGLNYAWSGSFPYIVAPGTNPTAVGSGYVPRTDVTLRDDLVDGDGSSLVGFQQSGTGAVARTVQDKLRRLEFDAYADFGVQADGVTDDSAAFEKAIAAAAAHGRRLILPEGTAANPRIIRITRPLVIPSGMTAVNWLGGGSDKTIIRLDAATLATEAIPLVGAPKFIRIAGIRFDQNNATTATSVGMMGIQNGEDIEIEFCEFLNFDKMGLAFNGCCRWKVNHNKFQRSSAGGLATDFNQAFLVSESARTVVDGEFAFNRCVGSATNFAGANLSIHHNDISGWGFGAGVTIEQTPNTYGNSIRANKCHSSLNVVDVNGYCPAGIENWGYNSEISYNVLYGNAGAGMDQGGKMCRVIGNICYNNGQNMPSPGISNRYGNATYNASGSYYDGNRCFDTQTTKTQTKGFEDQSALLSEISFGPGNQWNTNGTTPEVILSATPSYYGPAVESAPVSWNPPSIAAGGSAAVGITVPGASMGDYVVASFDRDLQGLTLTGYVKDTNTVVVVLSNNTGAAIDVAAGNIRARAIKPKNFSPY